MKQLFDRLFLNRRHKGLSSEDAALARGLRKLGMLKRSPAFKRAQIVRLESVLDMQTAPMLQVWAVRMAAAAVVSTTALGGVVAAAQSSLPGDQLYTVKRASESVVTAVDPSFSNQLLIRRSHEIAELTRHGHGGQQVEGAVSDYLDELHRHGGDTESSTKSINNLNKAAAVSDASSKLAIEAAQTETEHHQEDNSGSRSSGSRSVTSPASPTATPTSDGGGSGSGSDDGSGSGKSR